MQTQTLHIVNGKITAPNSDGDIASLLDAAFSSPNRHLILHFHGGLITHSSGIDIANKLAPVYDGTAPVLTDHTPTSAMSCFFIWDSGPIEEVTHNLGDIAKDPLFQHLVSKVGIWVLKKIGGSVALKGIAGAAVDEARVRAEFADYFAGRQPDPPLELLTAERAIRTSERVATEVKGIADMLDVDQLAQEIAVLDIATDIPFQDVVTAVGNGTSGPGVGQPRIKGIGTTASTASPISPQGVRKLFAPSVGGAKGLVNWFQVAKAIAEIVIRVIRRHHAHRDHGMYITISEEVLRDIYIDKVGGIMWNQMKKDTADAFAAGANGGTLLLQRIQEMAAENPARMFKRITLIGHSTGAVFICNLIDKAATVCSNVKFDVIFLAPAVTHTRLAATLAANAGSIANFRQFAMKDILEAKDSIVPIVYPHSLLYFVSGLLEFDAANDLVDEPIVGMERFIMTVPPFDDQNFPAVKRVRDFLGASGANRAVWSDAAGGAGLNSQSHRHGDFDDDPMTLDSLAHILRYGF